MNKKGFLFTILILGIILAFPIFGFASNLHEAFLDGVGGNKQEIDGIQDKIKARNNKIKELEKSMEEVRKKLSQKRTEKVSLENQLGILDNHILQVQLDIETTEEKILKLELEIKELELIIEEKELAITRQQDILAEFMRTLQQSDNKNFIEILAAYESFSEFYNQREFVKTLEKDISSSLGALQDTKKVLENKKLSTDNVRVAQVKEKDTLTEKKLDLEEQIQAKEQLLIDTQSSERQFNGLLQNLRAQAQNIESEIAAFEREVRKKLEEQDKLDDLPADSSLLSWPVPSRYVTARFHDPSYPFRHVFEHSGLDIRAGQGTPLKAVKAGYVARAKRCKSASCYSYSVLVHSGGISTVYGHMSQILVEEGAFVSRGQIIGYSGGTPGTVGAGPFVTGPHLHFEVRKNGVPVNPLNYLIKDY